MISFCFGPWWPLCYVRDRLLSKDMCKTTGLFCFYFFQYCVRTLTKTKLSPETRAEVKMQELPSNVAVFSRLTVLGKPWCSSSAIKPPYLIRLHASSTLIQNMPQLHGFQMRAATFPQSGERRRRAAGNEYFKSSASERGFEFCKSVHSTTDHKNS